MNLNHSASDLQQFNIAQEGVSDSAEGFSTCIDQKSYFGPELSSISAEA